MLLLPSTLLTLLHLALPALSHASPQPPLLNSTADISLLPRHTLFLRQLSNLQTFDGKLGNTPAPPITNSGKDDRPFEVEGNTFPDFETAAQRSCDEQAQGCSREANRNGGGGGKEGGLKVNDCDEQKNKCLDAQKSAKVKDFKSAVASTNIGPDPDFPEFDLICEG